ncbi:unnamed protein product [Cunninghamella blakesleeana]
MGKGLAVEVPLNVGKSLPHLQRAKFVFHCIQLATILLTIFVVAPLIATENKYYGGSQPGPNYTIVMCVLSIGVPFILLYFPWAYEHQNKFKRAGKFALKPRTNMIFTSFYSFIWATCGIAMTVHANNPSNCNLDGELQENFGDEYTSAWATQCNLGKAGAAFAWITCIMWVATLIITFIIFWNEKQLVQQNIKESKQNRISHIEAQEAVAAATGGNDYHHQYDVHEDDIGAGRPQSFEQARPLHDVSPQYQHQPSPQQHQQPSYEASPFEDPSFYRPPQNNTNFDYQNPYDPPNPNAGGFSMPQPSHYQSPPLPEHRF